MIDLRCPHNFGSALAFVGRHLSRPTLGCGHWWGFVYTEYYHVVIAMSQLLVNFQDLVFL